MFTVCSIEDTRAGEFKGLYMVRSPEAGVRMFFDVIVHGQDNMIRRHPEDYQLVYVGDFDELSGELTPTPEPAVLMTAQAIVDRYNRDIPAENGSGDIGELAGRLLEARNHG